MVCGYPDQWRRSQRGAFSWSETVSYRGRNSMSMEVGEQGCGTCWISTTGDHNNKQLATHLVPPPPSTAHINSLLVSVMAGGVALSEGVRTIVIHMKESCFLDAKAISFLTGIPLRTVYHVLAIWRKTGEAKPAPEGKQGRPRALDFGDTQVSGSSQRP